MDWAPTVNLGYESGGTELKSSSSVRRDEKMKQKEDLQSRLECAGTMLDLQQIREASTSDWDHTDESDEQDGYHRSDGTTKDAGSTKRACCGDSNHPEFCRPDVEQRDIEFKEDKDKYSSFTCCKRENTALSSYRPRDLHTSTPC
uniref:Uncharacterized protein n=1 Tax=Larimichthys crocea TaxID=215358 RepID=A0A0F8CGW1_LARCR